MKGIKMSKKGYFSLAITFFTAAFILYNVNDTHSVEPRYLKYDAAGRHLTRVNYNEVNKLRKSYNNYLASASGTVVPGSSVQIHHRNNKLFEFNEGISDDSPVMLASVTKTFTAFLVFTLIQDEVLELHAPVSKYLEGHSVNQPHVGGDPITIGHLMQHRSGYAYHTRLTAVRLSNGRHVSIPFQIRKAGETHMYSNYNYQLIKDIIEVTTGRKFSDLMREKVFIPLEMKNADARASTGAGALRASSSDLTNFSRMVLNGGIYKGRQVLRTDLLYKMFDTPEGLNPKDGEMFYAYGWRVIKKGGEIEEVYHTGMWNGSMAQIRIFPDRKAFLVHTANPRYYKAPGILSYKGTVMSLGKSLLEAYTVDELDVLQDKRPEDETL